MSCYVIRPRDHQEWLKHREAGIGSSDVGTILGVNPFETPYQLWRRKVGIDPPKAESFAMKAGHYLEDAVSRFFADETGYTIDKSSAGDWLLVCTEKPFMRVSPDRVYEYDGGLGILECKTTQMDIDADDIPQHWYCQLQYQLGVGDYGVGSLAWLTRGAKFGHKEYELNEDFYRYIVDAVERFWFKNIVGKEAPAKETVEDVLLGFPRHEVGKQVIANDDLIAACKELKELKEELTALEQRKKSLEDDIKMAMTDAEALVSQGDKPVVLATWKAAKDSVRFNEKQFAAENPALYKQYQFTQPGSRRFLIK